MDDRRRAKEEIKQKMEEHGISADELRKSKPVPKKSSKEAKEPNLQSKKPRPRRRRTVKNPRASSETRITTGGFIGSEPVVGNGPRPITDSPVLGDDKEISNRIWGRR